MMTTLACYMCRQPLHCCRQLLFCSSKMNYWKLWLYSKNHKDFLVLGEWLYQRCLSFKYKQCDLLKKKEEDHLCNQSRSKCKRCSSNKACLVKTHHLWCSLLLNVHLHQPQISAFLYDLVLLLWYHNSPMLSCWISCIMFLFQSQLV
jgi:hypothetical protein